MTMRERILSTAEKNPGMSKAAIAKKLGCSKSYVYNLMTQERKKAEGALDLTPEMEVKEEQIELPFTDIGVVLGQRGERYGPFSTNAAVSQNIKRAMATGRNWDLLPDDTREVLEMVALKLGRMLNGDPEYIDNVIDIIGYMRLLLGRMQGGTGV